MSGISTKITITHNEDSVKNYQKPVTATGLEPTLDSLAKWLSVHLQTKWLWGSSPVAVT